MAMSKRNDPYVLTPKDKLNAVIAGAKRKHQRFYIGVARKAGPRSVDAVRNRDRGGHHADQGVKHSYRLSLNRVNHTRFLENRNVCNLEGKLIWKHGNHPLCQNKKQGQRRCINADKGIVYVRVYSPKNSAAGRPRNRGARKGAKKRSK